MRPSVNEYAAWDDLRIFVAVAETGSFTRASERLGMGQPTVSRRIAEMEEALREPLFLRGTGAALTPAGANLLPAARRMGPPD